MYHIAICDDEVTICSQVEQIILEYGKVICEKMKVDVYYSGEELYGCLKKEFCYDMIFLDINLKSLNGIEVGEMIRDELKNEEVQIVYISANENYAMELFEIRPMNFLVKPLNTEKVKQVIGKGIELSTKICRYFNYKQGHNTKKKPIKDILHFESMDRQVKMVTIDEEVIFYGSLSEIFLELEQYSFFYIHKSFLVNYNHIIEFEYEQLIMSNKTVLPISRPRRKSVRQTQLKLEEGNL